MAAGHHHIIPIRTLGFVFGVLIMLTILTVVTSRIDLGVLNVPLALAIAGGKALLVALIFMALKYDNPVNALVLLLGVVFAVVFLTLTLTDTELRGTLGITESGTTILEGGHTEEAEQAVEMPAPATGTLPVANPEETFETYCALCHNFTGETAVGPTLMGLGDRQPSDSIRASIMEPDAVIISGYPPQLMSTTLNAMGFYSKVDDASMDTLIAWIASQ